MSNNNCYYEQSFAVVQSSAFSANPRNVSSENLMVNTALYNSRDIAKQNSDNADLLLPFIVTGIFDENERNVFN